MRSPIWSIEEIQRLKEFGAGSGWFYGIVRYEGKLHLGEIFPGLGFASVWPMYHPKNYWWLITDIFKACLRG